MLPRRIPKERKRSLRWRSPAHCTFVRTHECCVGGCSERPIEVAHLRNGTDAGMGRKASDFYTVSLCRHHHAEQHRQGEETFWKRIAWKDPHALAAEFCAASPKRREIEQAKRERGL